MVERSAVNRNVVGSSPTRGANLVQYPNFSDIGSKSLQSEKVEGFLMQ